MKTETPSDWRRQLLKVVKSWHRRADAADPDDDDETAPVITEAHNVGHWLKQWEPYAGSHAMADRILSRRSIETLRPVMADLNELLGAMED